MKKTTILSFIKNLKFGLVFLGLFILTNIYWVLIGGGESLILFIVSWGTLYIASLYGATWAKTWKV